MLRLDAPPDGVSGERWLGHSPVTSPAVGELWLLSWDGVALGLGLVSRTAPDFILCWPVTFRDVPVFAPAVVVDESPLDVSLVAWPTRETGVGIHLLHRQFGQLLSKVTLSLVEKALADEPTAELPLPLADQNVDGDAAERASDEMLDHWEAICMNVWPAATPGVSPLSSSAIQESGMEVGDIAAVLTLSLPTAVSLVRGEYAPTVEQVEMLSQALDADPQSFLEHGDGESTKLLQVPGMKDGLVRLAHIRSISESEARELVRADFALAARSDGDASSRLRSIIDRLLQSS
jgi:hypothetical protein